MNAKLYIQTLVDNLLPLAELLIGQQWVFQQDNAQILKPQHIKILDWPSCIPDLNPVENLWGSTIHKVYEIKRQYSSRNELQVLIKNDWYEIQLEIMEKVSIF